MPFITRKEFGQRLHAARFAGEDSLLKLLASTVVYKEALVLRTTPEGEHDEDAPMPVTPGDETQKPAVESSRRIAVTLSTTAVDRDQDMIVVAGMDVTWFARYGSVLWAHGYRDNPMSVLGRCVNLQKLADRVVGEIEFVPEGWNARADYAYKAMRAGYVSGLSVGVRLLEVSRAGDREGYNPMNVLRCELVELSVVPCPAHPGAVRIDAPVTDEKSVSALAAPALEIEIKNENENATITRSAWSVLLPGC